MRVYTYIIEHDLGFAPNPFHGVCSLACCKPGIRRTAQLGDVIVGTGSAGRGRAGMLIYWMRVDEITDFQGYWDNPLYARKRPVMSGSRMLRYGDNIYHRQVQGGPLLQEDSFHSEPGGVLSASNLKRDTTQTERVLLARDYVYHGRSGPAVPPAFSRFVKNGPGHLCRFDPSHQHRFVRWLESGPPGIQDRPTDWP